jgi:hypothetical protein
MTETMTEEKQAAPAKEEKALAKKEQPQIIVHDTGEFALLLDSGRFNQLWRAASMFSNSTMVPTHYQRNPANCAVAIQMALRLGIDPFAFMQKTYIVQGKPGMEAQLVIALVNTRGPFEGPIQWVFQGEGKSRSCTAFAKHRVTGEICKATVDWAMVEGEGWAGKSGSKWKTMPEMMFRYRTATFLARLYCPEVIMGIIATVDELVDQVGSSNVIENDPGMSRTDKLGKMLSAPLPDDSGPAVESIGDGGEVLSAEPEDPGTKAEAKRQAKALKEKLGQPAESVDGDALFEAPADTKANSH